MFILVRPINCSLPTRNNIAPKKINEKINGRLMERLMNKINGQLMRH